jgi:uncharacterized membrane protein
MLFRLALVIKVCLVISANNFMTLMLFLMLSTRLLFGFATEPPTCNVVVVGVICVTLAYVCSNCGGYCLYYS